MYPEMHCARIGGLHSFYPLIMYLHSFYPLILYTYVDLSSLHMGQALVSKIATDAQIVFRYDYGNYLSTMSGACICSSDV